MNPMLGPIIFNVPIHLHIINKVGPSLGVWGGWDPHGGSFSERVKG